MLIKLTGPRIPFHLNFNNMKIAIDLNDVVREYTDNFLRYYVERYNHEFDYDDFEPYTDDKEILFPFKTREAYERFTYWDYAFELYGKCPVCEKGLETAFNMWVDKTLPNIDVEESPEVIIVSPMEGGATISATYFFLSKLGVKVREVYFPKDSLTIWDKCDVLVTANPKLLEAKPNGKISIRIAKQYNEDCSADITYKTFCRFLEDNEIIEKIVKKEYEKE